MHIEDEPKYHSNFNMVTFYLFIKKRKRSKIKIIMILKKKEREMSSVMATGTRLTADQQGERPVTNHAALRPVNSRRGATHPAHTTAHRPTSVEAESQVCGQLFYFLNI